MLLIAGYRRAVAARSGQAAGDPQPSLRLPYLFKAHERPPRARAACVSRCVGMTAVFCMLGSIAWHQTSCDNSALCLYTDAAVRAYIAALRAVNLLPPRMKLRIYADMPWSIRLRAVVAPLKRQHPKELIEPRVGDDDVLPYDMLYRQMLDLVRC